MQYIIYDKQINELVGIFKTYDEAFIHFINFNLLERLKYLKNKLMNEEFNCDNIDFIRDIDILINDICTNLYSENIDVQFLKDKLNLARDYLHIKYDNKYNINCNILCFYDNKQRSIFLNKIV